MDLGLLDQNYSAQNEKMKFDTSQPCRIGLFIPLLGSVEEETFHIDIDPFSDSFISKSMKLIMFFEITAVLIISMYFTITISLLFFLSILLIILGIYQNQMFALFTGLIFAVVLGRYMLEISKQVLTMYKTNNKIDLLRNELQYHYISVPMTHFHLRFLLSFLLVGLCVFICSILILRFIS